MSMATASSDQVEGVQILRNTREALAALDKDREVAVDLETSGLRPHADKIAVVSLYGDDSGKLGVLHLRGHMPAELRKFLEDPTRRFTYHNGVSFDIPYLLHAGVKADAPALYDTIVAAPLLNDTNRRDHRVSLQAEVERRLGVTLAKDADHTSWMNPELTPQQVRYCAEDIVHLHATRRAQLAKGRETGQERALQLESDIVGVTARMTYRGLPISLERLGGFLDNQAELETELGRELIPIVGAINFGSHVQVRKAIAGLGLVVPTTEADFLEEVVNNGPEGILGAGTGYKIKGVGPVHQVRMTSGLELLGPGMNLSGEQLAVIAESDYKQAELIIDTLHKMVEMRKAKKRQSSYGPKFQAKYIDDNGIVHARFWQTGTDTGRYSSTDPNLQQVPRDMREVFGNHAGISMVAVDYSQIEVVVAAFLAGDEELLELIAHPSGDVHSLVAEAIFNLNPGTIKKGDQRRVVAKACSFTLLFGGGAGRLVQQARQEGAKLTMDEGKEIVKLFFNRFKGLARVRGEAYQTAQSGHRAVTIRIISGMRRILVGEQITPTRILNNQVQGAAAAGLKQGLKLAKAEGLAEYLGATVHDEVVGWIETKWAAEYAEALGDCMIRGMQKYIPTTVRVERKVASHWL